MVLAADIWRTNTGSPNNLMDFMMDILSCQSRKSAGEIMTLMMAVWV